MCLLTRDSTHGGVMSVLGAVVDDLELLGVKEIGELLKTAKEVIQ